MTPEKNNKPSESRFDFLLCSERSGSNLIRVMLDAHSQIHAPGPTHLGRLFIPKLDQYGDLAVDANFRRLVEDVVIEFDRKHAHSSFSLSVDELIENVTARDFCSLYQYINEKGMRLQGKSRIFIKENHSHRFVDYWLRHFPQTKFVFQVRDPRDFYLSAKKYRPFLTMYHSPRRTLGAWETDQRESLRILEELGPERVFLLRYEDLISNPEDMLQKLCQFLGIPFEAPMLEFQKSEAVKKDASSRSGWNNLSKKVMGDNKEKYRTGLSRTEILNIEYRLGDYMKTFRYSPCYGKVPGALMTWALFVEGIREVLANIYRWGRDRYRRARDIVRKLLAIMRGK